jgi:hypothetical protein
MKQLHGHIDNKTIEVSDLHLINEEEKANIDNKSNLKETLGIKYKDIK